MAIFSKLKGNKAKDPKPADKAPVERVPYVPRYAVRDALQCSPVAWREDSYDAFRKAYEDRMSRAQSELSVNRYSNPKMSPLLTLSRNSSTLSMPQLSTSRPSSRRQSDPFGSASSSYHNMSVLLSAPSVPAIPAQYAQQSASAGPSTPRNLSRNSSFQGIPVPPVLDTRSAAEMAQRHRPAHRHSHSGAGFSVRKSPMRQTQESVIESSEESVVAAEVDASSAVSTTSASSGEAIEMAAVRHDSPQMAYTLSLDKVEFKSDRQMEKAPAITVVEPAAPSPRKYFGPAKRDATAQQVPTPPQSPAPKKARFSLMRRSHAVSAH